MFTFLQCNLGKVNCGIIVVVECLQKYVFFYLKQIVCSVRVSHIFEPGFCPQYQLIVAKYATCLVLKNETTNPIKNVYLSDMNKVEIINSV